ncbi:MAG: hypothetical protein MMC33_001364 [Icmadophila ericetorum]|nr:hypothetical protein [Icmadophila ericetorum]
MSPQNILIDSTTAYPSNKARTQPWQQWLEPTSQDAEMAESDMVVTIANHNAMDNSLTANASYGLGGMASVNGLGGMASVNGLGGMSSIYGTGSAMFASDSTSCSLAMGGMSSIYGTGSAMFASDSTSCSYAVEGN